MCLLRHDWSRLMLFSRLAFGVGCFALCVTTGCSARPTAAERLDGRGETQSNAQAPRVISIHLSIVPGGCRIRIRAEEWILSRDQPDSSQQRQLEARLTSLAVPGAEFLITPTNTEIPYWCVGRLLSLAPKLGVRVGFVAELPA
jgi:hypothetical protein